MYDWLRDDLIARYFISRWSKYVRMGRYAFTDVNGNLKNPWSYKYVRLQRMYCLFLMAKNKPNKILLMN